MARIRQLFGGPASAALVLMMFAGCLFLWIGVPVAWLWIGSQVESSAPLGTALMVTMVGFLVTVIAMMTILGWINRRHAALQEVRNRPVGSYSALEVIFVSSAGIAVVAFSIWFFGFAGASPLPLNIGF